MKVFAADEQLISAGATSYQLATSWCWYDGGNAPADKRAPISVARIDKICSLPQVVSRTDQVLIDNELYDLVGDWDYATLQLKTAAMRWKTNQPHRKIGFYTHIPEFSYWIPYQEHYYRTNWNRDKWRASRTSYLAWKDRNTRNADALLPFVDFVAVQAYEFEQEMGRVGGSGWRIHAHENISEALRLCDGKPVFVVMMPSLHPCRKAIPQDYWGMMLEFVASYPVDGIMIHHSPTYVCDPQWRDPVIQLAQQIL